MLVSGVGSVKLMITNAFEPPVTCHSPAVAAVGSTVVGTPLITVPKFKSLSVAIVMPTVTTTASAARVPPDCAETRPLNPRHIATSSARFTGRPAARNLGPPEPSARPWDRDPRARRPLHSAANTGRAPGAAAQPRSPDAAPS